MDLQHVIILSGDVVALDHLRDVPDYGNEIVRHLFVHLLEFDRTKDHETHVEFLGIQDGYVFLDITSPLETFQALEYRSRCEVHLGRKFLGGKEKYSKRMVIVSFSILLRLEKQTNLETFSKFKTNIVCFFHGN